MERFSLVENLFIHPTPGGAYHAISATGGVPARTFLKALLEREETPQLTLDGLKEWSEMDDDEEALSLLHRLQKLSWVQGLEYKIECPSEPLEDLLPLLLKSLVGDGKALLADSEGFYITTCGFDHEVAEELSGLSAELANVHERRSSVLVENLGMASSAWAVVDAAGNSKVGFWPLYIGEQRFVLVVSGLPHLNHPEFVNLVWALSRRYSKSPKRSQ